MVASKIKIKKVCEWCGQEFHALKVCTRFCCKKCNEHSYKARIRKTFLDDAEREFKEKTIEEPLRKLDEKIYLDIVEAAALLGITRMGLYKLIYSGKPKASKLSSRFTVIIRADIDAMLTAHPYSKSSNTKVKDITEFYTVQEIKDKYNISESWLYKIGREKNIPRVFKRGKTYWSKQYVEKYFAKHIENNGIRRMVFRSRNDGEVQHDNFGCLLLRFPI